MVDATIIIQNYNGLEILQKCLPSVVEEVERSNGNHTVMVVDNNSTDASVEFVETRFPQLQILKRRENSFIHAQNEAVRLARHEIVILLNNDLVLERGCISYLLSHFNEKDVFAVRSKLVYWDKENVHATTVLSNYKYTYIDPRTRGNLHISVDKVEYGMCPTLIAGAGGGAFHRGKLLDLGLFDALYYPFYDEDLDTTYRAWKRGWKSIYEPRAIMYHLGGATISKYYSATYLGLVKTKNRYLFQWKNIRDREFRRWHIYNTLRRLPRAAGKLDWIHVCGFLWALTYLPGLKRSLANEDGRDLFSDRQVCQLTEITDWDEFEALYKKFLQENDEKSAECQKIKSRS